MSYICDRCEKNTKQLCWSNISKEWICYHCDTKEQDKCVDSEGGDVVENTPELGYNRRYEKL